jgi:hypothetical protein
MVGNVLFRGMEEKYILEGIPMKGRVAKNAILMSTLNAFSQTKAGTLLS